MPLILAHRGARKYAPENTIPALKKAIEMGVDGVEIDVMATIDCVPVVVHDNNLSSLTGESILVSRTPFSELCKIDVGKHFDPYFAGERIPTLKEALDVLADGTSPTKFLINAELKGQQDQHKRFVERVVEVLGSSHHRIIVSSFSPELLYKAGRLAPHFERALLCRPRAFSFLHTALFANITAVSGINPHISILNRRMVNYARRRGLNIITWTTNTPEQIRKALEFKVDGIVTDELLLAKEMVR